MVAVTVILIYLTTLNQIHMLRSVEGCDMNSERLSLPILTLFHYLCEWTRKKPLKFSGRSGGLREMSSPSFSSGLGSYISLFLVSASLPVRCLLEALKRLGGGWKLGTYIIGYVNIGVSFRATTCLYILWVLCTTRNHDGRTQHPRVFIYNVT